MGIRKTAFALVLGLLVACLPVWAHGAMQKHEARRAKLANPQFLVSARQLEHELGSPNLLVIDARGKSAYAAGHIPGAVDMPLSRLQHTITLSNGNSSPAIVKPAREIAAPFERAGIDRKSRIVIYSGNAPYVATRVWWMLDYYGHKHIAILDGGLPAWRQAGGKLSTRKVATRRGNFQPVPDPKKIATYSYVVSHIGSKATALCDALSAQSYKQGAIPGSINIPYTKVLVPKAFEKLKGASQLASLLESMNLSKDRPVIFYCSRGYLSSLEYFVARALGYRHVRLYDGSLSNFTAHGGKLEPSGGK